MSDEPTERDVEALITAIPVAALKSRASVARAVLASDWYAERIAEARREGAAEALDEASDHQYAVAAGLRGWLRGRASVTRRGDTP